jgi:hypothetical protein
MSLDEQIINSELGTRLGAGYATDKTNDRQITTQVTTLPGKTRALTYLAYCIFNSKNVANMNVSTINQNINQLTVRLNTFVNTASVDNYRAWIWLSKEITQDEEFKRQSPTLQPSVINFITQTIESRDSAFRPIIRLGFSSEPIDSDTLRLTLPNGRIQTFKWTMVNCATNFQVEFLFPTIQNDFSIADYPTPPVGVNTVMYQTVFMSIPFDSWSLVNLCFYVFNMSKPSPTEAKAMHDRITSMTFQTNFDAWKHACVIMDKSKYKSRSRGITDSLLTEQIINIMTPQDPIVYMRTSTGIENEDMTDTIRFIRCRGTTTLKYSWSRGDFSTRESETPSTRDELKAEICKPFYDEGDVCPLDRETDNSHTNRNNLLTTDKKGLAMSTRILIAIGVGLFFALAVFLTLFFVVSRQSMLGGILIQLLISFLILMLFSGLTFAFVK